MGYIIRNFCDNESRILMYKVRIRSLVEHWMFILSSVLIKDKLRLESLQKRFTLRVLGTDCTLNYKCWCNKIELDSSWKKRLRLNLIFFSKTLNKLSFTSDKVIKYVETPRYSIHNSLSLVKQLHCKCSLHMNHFSNEFFRL